MKIKDNAFNVEAKKTTIVQLEDLLAQPSDQKERPCPGCRFATPDGRTDRKATQFCSYSCPAAPKQMSSDPLQYPIEAGVVPITYAFYTLRKLMPCWSCEGHLDGLDRINKRPKVWFYSTSSFYPKLISQSLSQMEAEKRLTNSWMVKILPFSQSMYTITYSLEPFTLAKQKSERESLSTLRTDLITIADHLRPEVFKQAMAYIDRGSLTPFNSK
ncbi:MAG: hypothetical protein V3T17_18725 [Pseudomonadales bacterium]